MFQLLSDSSDGPILLAGDINSENLASQDSEHIAKKLKNAFYNPSDVLIMGDKFVSLGYLINMVKKFSKNLHHLVASDLDPTDRMNYK